MNFYTGYAGNRLLLQVFKSSFSPPLPVRLQLHHKVPLVMLPDSWVGSHGFYQRQLD